MERESNSRNDGSNVWHLKTPYDPPDFDAPPKEAKESEADIHLKHLLKKQLDTKTSLQKELSREKKEFAASSLLIEKEQNKAGIRTLREFQKAKEDDAELMKLRDYGLTDEELILKLQKEGGQVPRLPKRARYGESADSEKKKMEVIESKVQAREELLRKADQFSNIKEMSRIQMEIEASLHRGTEKAKKMSHLVKQREDRFPANDPVLLTLKEYEKQRQASTATEGAEIETETDGTDGPFIGPVLAPLHVRVKALDERIVQARKLNLDKLKSMPKFQNYEPGSPSKVLFIKNLGKDTCKEDLAALFTRFEDPDAPTMEYKLLKGRMRGQAFVTFPDESKATEALNFANGYILNGKPIVISFGKRKQDN